MLKFYVTREGRLCSKFCKEGGKAMLKFLTRKGEGNYV